MFCAVLSSARGETMNKPILQLYPMMPAERETGAGCHPARRPDLVTDATGL